MMFVGLPLRLTRNAHDSGLVLGLTHQIGSRATRICTVKFSRNTFTSSPRPRRLYNLRRSGHTRAMTGEKRAGRRFDGEVWRKHALVAGILGVLTLVLFLTGGFRSDDRADGLAVSALVQDAAGEAGAIDPRVASSWRQVYPILSHAGVATPLQLTERPPLVLEVAAPNETLIDAARDAVVRAGYEPVSGTRFAYGTLALKISRSPGARMSVAAVWSPYDGEPAEAGGARIAGPWWSVLPPLIA